MNRIVVILITFFICIPVIATPKITIITSVYDGDAFIEGFLKDITQQTIFDQCELIMINAASPGHEEGLIKEYAQQYPNIIYKKLEKDPGLYGVWNIGIQMGRGDYITNANLDDRLARNCYEAHAAYLDKHPEADLVYSDKYITYQMNETFESHTGIKWPPSPQATPQTMCDCWPCSNPMWRATLHKKYGLFDDSFRCSGDWDMWLRALEGGATLKKISGYYLLYYHNPRGLSTGKMHEVKVAEDAKIVERYGYLWGASNYKTYYTMARTLEQLSKDNPQLWPVALEYYLKAYTARPQRAEPLIRIAHYYVSKGQPTLAYLFASQAALIDCPHDVPDVEQELYEYVRYDILGQVSWYVQAFAEGEDAVKKALVACPDMAHLQRNLAFYVQRRS